MYRDMWVQQSLTLKVCGQGFLSEATFVGNVGIYSVGTESVNQIV